MSNIKKIILIFFSVSIILSYFFGFFYYENSIGSGGYKGDLEWMWKNFEIFKNESLLQAIKSKEFFGNRTALLYIINIYFNPFINNIDTYRLSITIFSVLAPCILFLCIKERYKDLSFETTLLFSLILLLSPFYRTSSFWGMETQYGIISSLISILFLFKSDKLENSSYRNIFLSILFSSATVYFDQKLIIIPIYIFIKIIFSNLNKDKKIFTVVSYILFAIPYFLLIILWNGIVPIATQQSNPLQITHLSNSKFHTVNILFTTNILGFYLFPFLILKKNIYKNIKDIGNKFNRILILLFLIYLLYFINFDLYDFVDKFTRESGGYKDFYGLGYSAKLGNILFENRVNSIILCLIIYIFSSLIIILFINSSLINLFLILFFFILSIALFPLMQEYFDPYIYIIAILLAKNEYEFNFAKCCYVFLFFSFFLVSSIVYYF